MIVKELVKEVANKAGVTQDVAKKVIEALGKVTKEALLSGEKVPFSDVGIFKVIDRKEKMVRDIQNGGTKLSPAHRVIKFSVNKNLKEEVR